MKIKKAEGRSKISDYTNEGGNINNPVDSNRTWYKQIEQIIWQKQHEIK